MIYFVSFSFAALNEAKVEARIQFKDVTSGIFKNISRNELVIRIQPSEAVYLKLNTKSPGFATQAVPVDMDLTYKRRFVDVLIPEAYETLIWDALKGDHSNFVRNDELDAAWKVQLLIRVACNSLMRCDDRSLPRFCIGSKEMMSLDQRSMSIPTVLVDRSH